MILKYVSERGTRLVSFAFRRYDKRRSPEPGRARLPNATAAELQRSPVRDYARMLEQRSDATAYLRDAAVEAGRLLHHGPQ